MAEKIIKFIFFLIYLLLALLLLALHGYFIYNSQQFPLTNYYWWLFTPMLIWVLLKMKTSSTLTFLMGLAAFLIGAVVRVFSTSGEIFLNTGFIVIILSLIEFNEKWYSKFQLTSRNFFLFVLLMLFLGIGGALITSHQGIAQKLALILYVYLIISFIAYGKDS